MEGCIVRHLRRSVSQLNIVDTIPHHTESDTSAFRIWIPRGQSVDHPLCEQGCIRKCFLHQIKRKWHGKHCADLQIVILHIRICLPDQSNRRIMHLCDLIKAVTGLYEMRRESLQIRLQQIPYHVIYHTGLILSDEVLQGTACFGTEHSICRDIIPRPL